jgi:hypothetical protein
MGLAFTYEVVTMSGWFLLCVFSRIGTATKTTVVSLVGNCPSTMGQGIPHLGFGLK